MDPMLKWNENNWMANDILWYYDKEKDISNDKVPLLIAPIVFSIHWSADCGQWSAVILNLIMLYALFLHLIAAWAWARVCGGHSGPWELELAVTSDR